MHSYPPEPFRIKMVEPIRLISPEQRQAAMRAGRLQSCSRCAPRMFTSIC